MDVDRREGQAPPLRWRTDADADRRATEGRPYGGTGSASLGPHPALRATFPVRGEGFAEDLIRHPSRGGSADAAVPEGEGRGGEGKAKIFLKCRPEGDLSSS